MIFNFNRAVVDIDAEGTRNYYNSCKPINDCSCTGCKNYRTYIQNCPFEIKALFQRFGIDDLRYITEIIPYVTTKDDFESDGHILYGGFYHVKGKLIQGLDTDFESRGVAVTDNFEIYPANDKVLVDDDFPSPILQIELYAHIPWVISEKPDNYVY